MNIIQTENLTKKFNQFTSIKNVNLTIEEGEICAIIGKNGAGKSTLFKLIATRFFPTEGTIQLFETSTKNRQQVLPKISFMIENLDFFDEFTAKQNLDYYRLQEGVIDKERVTEVLKIVGLETTGKKKFREFSMGMKQRLGIALTLLPNPDCIILDEPTNGLDAQGITEIRQLLQQLNQEYGVTLVISSHILSELQLLATRFIFINDGQIIADISQKELQKKASKRLRLCVNDSAKTAQLLERNFPNIHYHVLPDKTFELVDYLNERDQINRLLVQNEVLVLEMRLEEGSLENYFLELLGGKAND